MSPHDSPPFAEAIPALADRIAALPRRGVRRLVAIAGLPAGGKSTLSAALTHHLGTLGHNAANVPMDGFHLDNRLIAERGLTGRKGAPETFDTAGFLSLVQRLKAEDEVVYPLFDRSRDIAIAGAGLVRADCDLVILEGNYLLFDAPSWDALPALWDLSIWVDTPLDVVRARCIDRWLSHGHSPEAARARALGNDVANAQRIAAARRPADITLADPVLVPSD